MFTYGGGAGVLTFRFFQYPPPFQSPEIFNKNLMIKDLLARTKSTISQPVSQPTEKPADKPAQPSLSPKVQAEAAAAKAGYGAGDEVSAVICKHQPARHPRLLFVEVPDWGQPVRCWVKDAQSWLPANPPHNRLKARYTGMASVEGDLVFESADVSRKSRLLKAR